jgi:hypothetical protein
LFLHLILVKIIIIIRYQACGDGTYDNGRTVCIPDGYDCPVTGAESGSTLPSGYSDNYTMTTDDTSTNWFIRFEADGEMPINHVELVLYSPSAKRGHCFKTAAGIAPNQESYGGKGKSDDYDNQYPGTCGQVDTRWRTLDYQDESDYMYENFIETSYCTGDRNTSDYLDTGRICGDSPFYDTDCMV